MHFLFWCTFLLWDICFCRSQAHTIAYSGYSLSFSVHTSFPAYVERLSCKVHPYYEAVAQCLKVPITELVTDDQSLNLVTNVRVI